DAASAAVAQEESARTALVAILDRQGLSPVGVSELASEAGVSADVARKVLTLLALDKTVVRISSEMHFMRSTIAAARATLTAHIEAHGPSSAADLRDALGVSRKYAIPLLEYFDAQGLTRREGDLRVLRKA
ncbi:MAG: SelB C-terminal domain-containing protein, partial [Actinomycetota bacterium]|nr:SelB C-terminal domain-containing protein [Actinomycetota bacterium]